MNRLPEGKLRSGSRQWLCLILILFLFCLSPQLRNSQVVLNNLWQAHRDVLVFDERAARNVTHAVKASTLIVGTIANRSTTIADTIAIANTTFANTIAIANNTHLEQHSCPGPLTGRLLVLERILKLLDTLDCPHFLHAGTFLNFVRDCEGRDRDLDVAVPFPWMKEHHKRFFSALRKAGFSIDHEFGNLNDAFGYEIHLDNKGMKGLREGEPRLRFDIFTVVEHPNQYYWSMWHKGNVHRCVVQRSGLQTFQWGNLTVRAPVPFEQALQSFYGPDWRLPPKQEWHWFRSAVTIGSCDKQPWSVHRSP